MGVTVTHWINGNKVATEFPGEYSYDQLWIETVKGLRLFVLLNAKGEAIWAIPDRSVITVSLE